MAVPTFVAAGALAARESPGNVTPALPTGWAENDICLMAVMTNQQNTFPAITGWTLFGTGASTANRSFDWYYRRMVSGDTAPSFTIASGTALAASGPANGLFARIWAFRGCTTSGTPFEISSPGMANNATTTPTSTAQTTTGADRLVVCIVTVDDDNTWSSGMPPASWTNRGGITTSTLGGDAMFDCISIDAPTATTVNAVTVGTMSASDNWQTQTLCLIGASSGTTVTGTMSASFGGLSASMTGGKLITGTMTGAFGGLAATMAGGRVINGTMTANLGGLTATMTGTRVVVGVLTGALGGLTGTMTGTRTVNGTLVSSFGGLTALISGAPYAAANRADLQPSLWQADLSTNLSRGSLVAADLQPSLWRADLQP